MCGINGIVVTSPRPGIREQVLRMNREIIHRGPDEQGDYVFGQTVAMSMSRLSVIDLATGQQPMYNSTRTMIIVFNGEIYNYRELRQSLQGKGVEFETESDTEVVLRLYEREGANCLQQLNGMFAFSIHDQEKEVIFIARDRLGEKPLYYCAMPGTFAWASELKSIVSVFPELKKLSLTSLQLYFALTYIPAPYSIYESVFKLQAGHCLTLDTRSLSSTITSYWDLPPCRVQEGPLSYDAAKKELRELLFDSVSRRMIADVPLGVFLSGGVDSSIIAAIMARASNRPIQTFSLGYDNARYDESARARTVAAHLNAEHHAFRLDEDQLLEDMDRIILNYDEPFADSSCLPTYFVSRETAASVKVALTGDGGDEVFGGYNKYLAPFYRRQFERYVPGFVVRGLQGRGLVARQLDRGDSKSALSKIKKVLRSLEGSLASSHLNIIALGFQQKELTDLLRDLQPGYKEILKPLLLGLNETADPLKILRYIDRIISLEGDMLAKVDRASMLCSLECRAPFLDHRLMEFSYRLPDEFLISGRNKKRILKDTFAGLLPAGFFNAPKSGFEIPIGHWLRGRLRGELETTLSAAHLEKHGLLNISMVSRLVADHITRRADHSSALWTLFCFQKWYNANMSA